MINCPLYISIFNVGTAFIQAYIPILITSHDQSLTFMQAQQNTPIWGKLIPLSKGLTTYPLKDTQIMIGRINCKIVIHQKRLSGKHCLLQRYDNKVYLTDFSTNGTYLNTQKLGKNNRQQIKDGDEIWLLPISKVSQQQTIGFKLSFLNQQMIKRAQNNEQTEKFMNNLKEQITCPFCCHIMIYPVTVQPCNHRFCGPCLTKLVNKKKGQCITCRKQLVSAIRDANYNAIIADYLRSHPQQKLNDEDEQPNIFGYTPTNIRSIICDGDNQPQRIPPTSQKVLPAIGLQKPVITKDSFMEELGLDIQLPEEPQSTIKKKQTKAKPRKPRKIKGFICSDISASTDSQSDLTKTVVCKQCVQQRNGFKCSQTQVHINCHNCSKPFARRQQQRLNQSCTICKSYFCNLYLPPCQVNGPRLTLLGRRAQSCKIQPIYFRNNRVQMDAFRNLLISEKKNVVDMFKDMVGLAESGRFQFMFDKRLLRSPPAEQRAVRLDKRSPVCDNCWRQLWFQMIFMFIKEHAYLMPDTIKNRPPCYWGINCRTMDHNLEHAKKFNHMEYQVRF